MTRATFALVALFVSSFVVLFETTASAEPGAVESGSTPMAADRRRETKAEYKAEIKSMDIHDRPHRSGHFYGNTVRRRSARSS